MSATASQLLTKVSPSAVKAVDPASRSMTIIASVENTDRDGDLILIDGIDLADYQQNPVFLLDHDYKAVIGKVVKLWAEPRREGKALMANVELLPAGVSSRADEAWSAIAFGARKGISIGFIPIEAGAPIRPDQWGKTFRRVGLMEISSVAVPSCPTCLVAGVHAGKEYSMPCECNKTTEIDLTPEQRAQLPSMIRAAVDAEFKKYTTPRTRRDEIDLSDPQVRRIVADLPAIVDAAFRAALQHEVALGLRRAAGRLD